ncbi:MAG: adenylosuccinate lyase [Pseudobdellovibrionaceae bacterium]
MIDRYTRPEMGILWDLDSKFGKMLEVEIAVAHAQAELGIIPSAAAKAIKSKGRFSVKRILEIEKETKHDVIAFVSNVAENVGNHGRFVHYGLTSSDVLDTAFGLQIREAGKLLLKTIAGLKKEIGSLAKKHADTICAGRTHGMFAEPTTFGLKLAGFVSEIERNEERIERAITQVAVAKLSGAVGTYSAQSPQVEEKVAKRLNLQIEPVATQVVPRDRHAEVITSLAIFGAALERLAVELRHLQRSEVSEVVEGFSKGQKGSSAMPHKKNPISSENITGLARLLRSYAIAAMEDVALWHERDISHSSVERVIFPDAFIIADYAAHRMAQVISQLQVNKKKMAENMDASQGQLFSSHVLLALVEKGITREAAYVMVQRASHGLQKGENLKQKLLKDPETKKLLSKKELGDIFSGKKHMRSIKQIMNRVV